MKKQRNKPPKRGSETGKDEKKPYIRKEHLMHRPFRMDESLRALQSNLHKKHNKENHG